MKKKGKLIVIEGIDSVGKETQKSLLYDRLKKKPGCEDIFAGSLPDYNSKSSFFIKSYLNDDYKNFNVNPYQISLFYAVDRLNYYFENFHQILNEGGIVVLDRYTPSNIVYQSARIKDEDQRNEFISWIMDLEYKKLQLPKPDITIILDLSVAKAKILLEERLKKQNLFSLEIEKEFYRNKSKMEEFREQMFKIAKIEKDVNEKDDEFLEECKKLYVSMAKKQGWDIIPCIDDNGKIYLKEDINKKIIELLSKKSII